MLVQLGVHKCVDTCGSQWPTGAVAQMLPISCFLRQGLTGLELTDESSLDGQRTPESHLCLSPQCDITSTYHNVYFQE